MTRSAVEPGVVLIVDDIPFNIRVLSRFLRADGHTIRTAEDGQTALAEAIAVHPDVVLLDVMLPRMDGYDVCRRLKADPGTRDIAVVMMSGLSASESRERGASAGADEFLTKPLDGNKVRALVRDFVARRRSGDMGAARPSPAEPGTRSPE